MRVFSVLVLTLFAFHLGYGQKFVKNSAEGTLSSRGMKNAASGKLYKDPIDPGFIEPDEISIAYNSNPGTLTYYGATGGSGSFSYQWQRSGDNENWSNINGATGLTYSPGNLTITTYYRVHAMQTDQDDEGFSSGCAVYVEEPIVIGNISPTQKTIEYNTNPGSIKFDGVTGGDGDFNYQWQSSADNKNWNNISGATTLAYSPGNMKGTTFYRVMADDEVSTVYSSVSEIIVKIKSGIISPASQTINSNAMASSLSCSAANDGGATLTYQWQSSIDNRTWNNIIGATGLTYSPGTLFTTNYFRVQISDAAQQAYSNTAIVNVNGSPTTPVTISESDITSPLDLTKPVGTPPGAIGNDGEGGPELYN